MVSSLQCQDPHVYDMAHAQIVGQEVVFTSLTAFYQAMNDGFFKISIPQDLDLSPARVFAETFTENTRYNQFGVLDVVNGYLLSEQAQTIRFTLERDYWNKSHINQTEVSGEPNYSLALQKIGHRLNEIGVIVLRSILKQHGLPENIWFKATSGASNAEGSHYLLFNSYNPTHAKGKEGLGAHKDWGYITVLDAMAPGLEAKIKGEWKKICQEDGFLTVNFGYPLEKLFSNVHASMHRVPRQNETKRTSIAAFIDPRVGSYRPGVSAETTEGYVYNWDAKRQELVNAETTIDFFTRLSEKLYGTTE